MRISKRNAYLIRLGIRLSRNRTRPAVELIMRAAHPLVRYAFLERLDRDNRKQLK